MNTTDEKLNLIGFKDFIHLNKKNRDNCERKVLNTFYDENWLNIKLKKVENEWTVETIDDNGIIQSKIGSDKKLTIENIIYFFKTFYYEDNFEI
jgi:hypothetical protein